MAKKAKSLYEVFAGSKSAPAGRTEERPKKTGKSRPARRKAGESNGFGDRRLTFSLSVNALMVVGLVLVIFLAGSFAMGRYALAAGGGASMTGGGEYLRIHQNPDVSAKNLSLMGDVVQWLDENAVPGVHLRIASRPRRLEVLVAIPPAGVETLVDQLTTLAPPSSLTLQKLKLRYQRKYLLNDCQKTTLH